MPPTPKKKKKILSTSVFLKVYMHQQASPLFKIFSFHFLVSYMMFRQKVYVAHLKLENHWKSSHSNVQHLFLQFHSTKLFLYLNLTYHIGKNILVFKIKNHVGIFFTIFKFFNNVQQIISFLSHVWNLYFLSSHNLAFSTDKAVLTLLFVIK